MRRLGLRFSENMYGRWERSGKPEGERRFVFHYDVASDDLWATLRNGYARATGWVEAEGLAKRASLEGFIVIKPLLSRFIRYEFDFDGEDGLGYHFAGQKTIRHLHPLRTWTTLPGAIFDADDKPIGSSVARFDTRETLPFLRSFRATRSSRNRE